MAAQRGHLQRGAPTCRSTKQDFFSDVLKEGSYDLSSVPAARNRVRVLSLRLKRQRGLRGRRPATGRRPVPRHGLAHRPAHRLRDRHPPAGRPPLGRQALSRRDQRPLRTARKRSSQLCVLSPARRARPGPRQREHPRPAHPRTYAREHLPAGRGQNSRARAVVSADGRHLVCRRGR